MQNISTYTSIFNIKVCVILLYITFYNSSIEAYGIEAYCTVKTAGKYFRNIL